MFYKKNPIYFIFWDTYICFQMIFRFKSFTYFYMYFLSTIWNDIDFHNWVYWCHLLVGWQKITCGLILLQEEASQRWDSEIFSLEFTKNLTLSKGEKKQIIYDFRNSPELTFLNINCGNGHKFLGTIISVDLSWTPNTSAVTRKTQQRLAPPQRVCWHAVSLHGTGAVLKQRGAGFSRSSTQLRRLSGFHSPPFCLSRPRNILKESSHPGSHLFDPTIKWPLWANTWQQWEGKTPNEQYLRLLEYSV